MTDTQSFTRYYKILNLALDADWDSCKRAYKKSVKRWHPDKFSHDKKNQHAAEEKLKDINVAYSQLSDYFQRYGILPGTVRIHSTRNRTSPSSESAQQFDVSSLYENLESINIIKKHSFKKYSILLLLAVIIMSYQYFSEQQSNKTTHTPIKQPILSASNRMVLPKINYFTYGSSTREVIDSQGIPGHKKAQIWYYGDSWVAFKNNEVVDWHNGQHNPLNINLDHDSKNYYSGFHHLNSYFEKGDSKLAVKEIQGPAIRVSKNVWYYEISKVYFKNDKVVSWFNSPLDPLRVPQ